MEAFRALGIDEEILEALEKKGFSEPTPIQAKTIPLLLKSDKDIIGQAQTGTGKTAAFGIPIVQNIKGKATDVQALVLAPTRELALQVAREIESFSENKKLRIATVYGGSPISKQKQQLKKGVHIVVGTPGRTLDLLKQKVLKLKKVNYVVLDEADEMLNMGFLEDVERILSQTNDDKRMLLFSATMPKKITDLVKRTMGSFETIKVKKQQLTTELTSQSYYMVRASDKFDMLCRVLDYEEEVYGIIFCVTRADAIMVTNHLNEKGFKADALHGDIPQNTREKVTARFRAGKIRLLVATDVAARGIDVQNLTHVINYSLPQDPESYVHRIGRTGRAGNKGKAISIISLSEQRKLRFIEKIANCSIEQLTPPNADDMVHAKKMKLIHSMQGSFDNGHHEKYMHFANELLDGNDPSEVVASLLDHFYNHELDANSYKDLIQSSRGNQSSGRKGSGKTVRLFIAKGRLDGFKKPKHLLDFIEDETATPHRKIRSIKILDKFSFFNVSAEESETILDIFKRKNKKKPLVVLANDK